jgi:hypothetical protein
MIDLAAELPQLLPLAVAWAQDQETAILATGRALIATESKLAAAVGVRETDRVRIKIVQQLPLPQHPGLRTAAIQTGLLGPAMIGITFGHGIYIRGRDISNRLVSHELRHVYQYEEAGSIAAFLATYLEQIVTFTYERAPLELDARRHERDKPSRQVSWVLQARHSSPAVRRAQ